MKNHVRALKKFLYGRNLELVTDLKDGKIVIVLHDFGSGEWAESTHFDKGTRVKYFYPGLPCI